MSAVSLRLKPLRSAALLVLPGLLLAGTIAMAARFVSGQYGGPVMLYALLFGIAFNYLASDEKTAPGLRLCSRTLLRFGVALLGLRITLGDVADLGWATLALVASGVTFALAAGWGIGRLCGLRHEHAVLSAGAVAVCGASAALAIAATLPTYSRRELDTSMTVVGATTLSTLAMILYPLLTQWLAFEPRTAGIFLGATIHDVAQAVGAGHMLSEASSHTAVIVKLLRVAMLVPVVVAIGWLFHTRRHDTPAARRPLLPHFLSAFLALMLLNSLWPLPAAMTQTLAALSSWCILAAVAALGVNTSIKDLLQLGPRPLIAMAVQTLLLAGYAAAWLLLT